MVIFVSNGYGYHGSHRFTFGWANDSGASINYDEYGWVTFNSSGYGENANVKVQLGQEYSRYFCSTATCGGFSDWISGIATVTPTPPPTHLECVNNICTKVSGAGTDTCTTEGSACSTATAPGIVPLAVGIGIAYLLYKFVIKKGR